ncbi:F-box protein CPR1-like [Papaver somniferum]|uniref:F-box protein CPR1-like n=1 Tax=Papaver somniferum TaxID=3469 RepID=UPI000E6F8646|nr:F-box protein CPR1-like [Papaver somniferum]
MHRNHAVENNNYSVFLDATYYFRRGPVPSYYRVDFDAAPGSSLNNKAVKINLPSSNVKFSSFIGSCNGILCFCRFDYVNSVTLCLLWNPSTQEFKDIVHKEPYSIKEVMAYGFGYDHKIDDYKLILMFQFNFNSEIHVYTLGSSSWKIIGNTPRVHRGTGADTYSLKLLNGSMHWVARKVVVTGDQQTVTKVIVSFDIAEEKTKEIQIPIATCLLVEEEYKLRNVELVALGNELHLSVVSGKASDIFELWVMEDYGVVDSWTKLFSISNNWGWGTLLSFDKSGKILLFTGHCSQGNQVKKTLVSYDLRYGRSTFLNIDDMPGRFTAETFIGNLVSLNSAR